MKVVLHYEDNENSDFHKTLKITLPKSWKTGPVSNLLSQFVESYNPKFHETNPLSADDMHLSLRKAIERSEKTQLVTLCSDEVVIDEIPDRGDVYICHGASKTKSDKQAEEKALQKEQEDKLKNTVRCTRFGCNKRFRKDGPIPNCQYHRLPPGMLVLSIELNVIQTRSHSSEQSFMKPQNIGRVVRRKRYIKTVLLPLLF